MLPKNIIVINRHFLETNIIQNNIFMVKTTGVRGPTLARLAMVLVLLSIRNTPALRVIMFQTGGKPSTWFPPVGLVELYFPSNSTLREFNR